MSIIQTLFFNRESNYSEQVDVNISLKLYRLTVNYADSFSADMLDALKSLSGNTLNNLPFMGSYMGGCTGVLLDFEYINGIMTYLFDFSVEKLEFNGAVPHRKIKHIRMECRHFIKNSTVLITEDKEVEDKVILAAAALMPYILLIKISIGGPPDYKPPRWQEINLTHEELNYIGNLAGEMFSKNITTDLGFKCFCNRVTICERHSDNAVTAKPFRSNSFIVRLKYVEPVKQLLINTKAEIKIDFFISPYVIDCIIDAVFIAKLNKDSISLLTPVSISLDSYFKTIHRDILQEARIKLERKILEDFIQLLSSDAYDDRKCDDISYIFFTAAFNILIKIAAGYKNPEESVDNLSFNYEALSNFLILYSRHEYNVMLNESRLDSVIHIFSAMVRESYSNINKIITDAEI